MHHFAHPRALSGVPARSIGPSAARFRKRTCSRLRCGRSRRRQLGLQHAMLRSPVRSCPGSIKRVFHPQAIPHPKWANASKAPRACTSCIVSVWSIAPAMREEREGGEREGERGREGGSNILPTELTKRALAMENRESHVPGSSQATDGISRPLKWPASSVHAKSA